MIGWFFHHLLKIEPWNRILVCSQSCHHNAAAVPVFVFHAVSKRLLQSFGQQKSNLAEKTAWSEWLRATEKENNAPAQLHILSRAHDRKMLTDACAHCYFSRMQSANSLRKIPLIQLLKIIAALHGHLQWRETYCSTLKMWSLSIIWRKCASVRV